MTDREKVIKELQGLSGSKETTRLISDAIALLKEQEPRVLSPDELFYMEHRCVYFEHRNNQVYSTEPSIVTSTRSFSPPILGRQYNFIREHKIKSTHWEIDYNKASNYGWRAWSYQPTEEQIKAVKWE